VFGTHLVTEALAERSATVMEKPLLRERTSANSVSDGEDALPLVLSVRVDACESAMRVAMSASLLLRCVIVYTPWSVALAVCFNGAEDSLCATRRHTQKQDVVHIDIGEGSSVSTIELFEKISSRTTARQIGWSSTKHTKRTSLANRTITAAVLSGVQCLQCSLMKSRWMAWMNGIAVRLYIWFWQSKTNRSTYPT